MLRISINVLLLTVGSLLVSYGIIHVSNKYLLDDDQRVKFITSLGHPSLMAGERQRTFIKVDLLGFKLNQERNRPPVNVALVLDKSGSMNGEKMEQAKAAAIQAVELLGEEDIVSIITYDSAVNVLVAATPLTNKQAIRRKIQGIHANGGTALYAGVTSGAGQLQEFLSSNRVNRVILLSDGQANQGPSSPAELGELGATLIRENISVTTIGLGLGYNEDLMVQLALRSDGNHNFVEHADKLAGVFHQEFGDVMSVVAQDVKVVIDLEEGIRPISVQGREAHIDGQTVEVELSQLYGDQEKYVLLEIETEPEERSGEQEIAHVEVSYANMVTDDTDYFSETITAHFTDNRQEVEESVDAETMVSAVEQQAVLNEEMAIQLQDAGKKDEAEEILRQNAAFLDANAARYDSDKLLKSSNRALESAASLDTTDWKRLRKEMRSAHYKTKTQQKN